MPLLSSRSELIAGAARHPVRAAGVLGLRARLRGGRAWTPAGTTELVERTERLVAAGAVEPITPVPGRVLHVVTNALPIVQAGYTLRTAEIVAAQRELGLDPEVVTRWGWPVEQGVFGAAPSVVVDGTLHHRLLPQAGLPASPERRARLFAADLELLVRRRRPSVIHAATDHPNGAAALSAARRAGLPFVYEVRGLVEESPAARGEEVGPAAAAAREAETLVLLNADAVVVLGEGMRAELIERGVAPERIAVAPNAVDTSVLAAEVDGTAFRAAHGIGERELVVGTVSTLHHYEGLDVLLRAVAQLRQEGLTVRPLIVGDGPARSSLEELAAELGLTDAVFTGRVPHEATPGAFAALDVMAVPRTDHRVCRIVTPLKPVQAMALGVPVLASDLPALRELTDDGRLGLHAPPGDVAAWAAALRELLEATEATRERAGAAREHVLAVRTWQQAARVLQGVYGTVGASSDRRVGP